MPITQLQQYAAVRLFIERALFKQPSFSVTNANAPAVAQICYRLDGIPLAIELAAARVKALSVEKIAERLDDRFHLLTGGSRTAMPRHQTLRALIDWSYDLLEEAEKILLRRLSVFAGGWTLEAAEDVCADDAGAIHESPLPQTDVLDLLTRLVDKSLVVLDERGADTRYRMLETIRQYAREKLLESGERERVRDRHLDFFMKLAEEAEPHLRGTEQVAWYNRLEQEHDNLRAALEWSQVDGTRAEKGLRLAGALWQFWEVRNYFGQARAILEQLLSVTETSMWTLGRARALHGAGVMARLGENYKIAQARHTESLAIYRELSNKAGVAHELGNLGLIAWRQADFARARSLYEESLALFRELNNLSGIADSHGGLSLTARAQGDYALARSHSQEGLTIRRKLGDKLGVAVSLQGLAKMVEEQGDDSAARKYWEESLGISQELGQKFYTTQALDALGYLALNLDDKVAARHYFEQSLRLAQESDGKFHIAISLGGLGKVAQHEHDYVTAHSLYAKSLTLFKELDNKQFSAILLIKFASLAAIQGMASRATRLLAAAEVIKEELNTQWSVTVQRDYDSHVAAARAQLSESDFNAAWEAGRALTLEQAIELAMSDEQPTIKPTHLPT